MPSYFPGVPGDVFLHRRVPAVLGFNVTVLDSRHVMLRTAGEYAFAAARDTSNYQFDPPIAVTGVGLRTWLEGYRSLRNNISLLQSEKKPNSN